MHFMSGWHIFGLRLSLQEQGLQMVTQIVLQLLHLQVVGGDGFCPRVAAGVFVCIGPAPRERANVFLCNWIWFSRCCNMCCTLRHNRQMRSAGWIDYAAITHLLTSYPIVRLSTR